MLTDFSWKKPFGEQPLGRQRCRWENNIKIDPSNIGCQNVIWITFASDRGHMALVLMMLNLKVLVVISH
jgi:hypothetical protein